jgi:hypothetical protein
VLITAPGMDVAGRVSRPRATERHARRSQKERLP